LTAATIPWVLAVAFSLAAAAPWMTRAARRASGWCFGLASLGLFAALTPFLASTAAGQPISVSYPWVSDLGIHLSFYMDGLSLLFALLIAGVGALVMVYTGSYLKDHPHQGRFFAYLWLFEGAMLGVVLAGNLIALFVFWELTSFASYLLIGFHHENAKARAAALQALLVTGLGGLALMAGFILIGFVTGTWDIAELLTQPDALRGHPYYAAILTLILFGAFTKSAQFPFHFWLPNAMEAPTPASAYLHSATMVKAGIFLLARLHPLLGDTSAWRLTLAGVGAVTLLVGASAAIFQKDLKRILAYSTVGALGLLTMLLGLGTRGAISAAIVFLVAHVLYKGALFLVAGAVDHETGERHIDRLSGLARRMPVLAGVALLAGVSFAAAGPVLNFIGKEMILASVLESGELKAVLAGAVVAGSALFAAAALLVGFKPFFGPPMPARLHHEPALSLWISPAVLSAAGLLTVIFQNGLTRFAVGPAAQAVLHQPHTVELSLWHGFNLPLALSVFSLLAGGLLYHFRDVAHALGARLSGWSRWGPDGAYEYGLKVFERFAGWHTRVLQNGRLRFYLMVILLTTVGLAARPLLFTAGDFAASVGPAARFHEVALVLLIALGAATAVRINSRLAAIASLGVAGYGVALLYTLFSAPDLAMTQFLIETLSVVLLLRVLYRLPRFADHSSRWILLRDGFVATAAGAQITALVLLAANTAFDPATSRFFVENSWTKAHGRNIVNVIIVDFRAFDTFGEITVLATAALGVYGLLHMRGRTRKAR
jgi:multicomponent Na+:H+ antiporter subunit A